MRTYYHKNNMVKTTPVIQLPPTGSYQSHVEIMGTTIQDEIWWGHSRNVSIVIVKYICMRILGN